MHACACAHTDTQPPQAHASSPGSPSRSHPCQMQAGCQGAQAAPLRDGQASRVLRPLPPARHSRGVKHKRWQGPSARFGLLCSPVPEQSLLALLGVGLKQERRLLLPLASHASHEQSRVPPRVSNWGSRRGALERWGGGELPTNAAASALPRSLLRAVPGPSEPPQCLQMTFYPCAGAGGAARWGVTCTWGLCERGAAWRVLDQVLREEVGEGESGVTPDCCQQGSRAQPCYPSPGCLLECVPGWLWGWTGDPFHAAPCTPGSHRMWGARPTVALCRAGSGPLSPGRCWGSHGCRHSWELGVGLGSSGGTAGRIVASTRG